MVRAFSRMGLRAFGALLVIGSLIALYANPGDGANLISLLQPPALIQTATNSANSALSLTASFGTTPAVGHTLLCGFSYSDGTEKSVTIPSGWTLDKAAADGVSNIGIAVAHRIVATGDPTSYTFSLSGTGGNVGLTLSCGEYVAGGVDTNNLSVVSSAVTQSTTTFSTPSVALSHRAALPIAFVAINQIGLTHTTSGWTEDGFVQAPTGGQNMMMQMLEPTTRLLNIGATTSATTTYNNTGSYHGINVVVTLLPNTGSFSQIVAIAPTPTPTPTATPTPSCTYANGVEWATSCIPYGTASVWNQALPASPAIWSGSSAVMAYMFNSTGLQQVYLRSNEAGNNDYGHPVYFASSTDPTVTITCSTYCDTADNGGLPTSIHIPAKARPAGGTCASGCDKHMDVVQPDNTEVGFFGVTTPSGDWGTSGNTSVSASGAANCGSWLTGSGMETGGYTTAGGACVGAGLLRANEMLAGNSMGHALFIVVNCAASSSADLYPAPPGTSTAVCTNYPSHAAPPLGSRLWLDYSDSYIRGLALPPWEQALALTLHDYGGYVMDNQAGGADVQGFAFKPESGEMFYAFGQSDPFAGLVASPNLWSNAGTPSGSYQPRYQCGPAAACTSGGELWEPLSQGIDFAGHMHILDPCVTKKTC